MDPFTQVKTPKQPETEPPGREKQIKTFYASVVDKNSNKTVKKLTLNIEISIPKSHELVMNKAKHKHGDEFNESTKGSKSSKSKN